ncbi:MAG: protein kinase [Deltaproteobacteria bacterium]|nr:protein kinase [Deltaproteobacteria bacterium]
MTRYELLDRIGVGGMAEIFRGKAVAAGGFEKPVAIKRILPHLSQDKRFVELLIAEAKILSLLKHRNIVQIFDVGLGDDGQYFLVMEYVDGKDLGAVQKANETKRKRLPFDLALHIGAELCEALEHAHSAKAPDGKPMSLVHRDVSPSNVLLSRAGEVKLTDFGIAKRAEAEQTGTGGVRGKFAYISPEQARNEHIEPRSDVFSVAILIWELVTNRRLFSGLGDLEALRAVREAQVQRPSEVDARLSGDIDKILMAALSRDPKRRPTAGQFGQQLTTLRYSLEATLGDPATELGKIIDQAEQVARESQQLIAQQLRQSSSMSPLPFEHSEPSGNEHTVIRIRTADVFSQKDKDGRAMAAARQVINQFEEDETKQAQLTGDQLKLLRGSRRDSSQLAAPPAPRSKRGTDEPTTARAPLHSEEVSTIAGRGMPKGMTPGGFDDGEEATRLVAPTSRRTPAPERVKPRGATVPPPLPGMTQPKPRPRADPNPPLGELPSTVHQRNPRLQSIGGPPSMPGGPPAMPPEIAPPPTGFEEQAPVPGTMHIRSGQTGLPAPQQPAMQPLPMQPPVLQPPTMGQVQPGVIRTPQPGQLLQQPMLPPPMQNPMQPMQARVTPQPLPQQQNPYGMWGGPQQQQQPMQQHHSAPPTSPGPNRKSALQPWMLVVGALVMAVLAFAITRAFISG